MRFSSNIPHYRRTLAFILFVAAAGCCRAQSSAPITGGDRIRIELEEDAAVTFEGVVAPDGSVSLPYLGHVVVAGRDVTACADLLAIRLQERLYEKATVHVHVISRAPAAVRIYGEVAQAGAVALPASRRLSIVYAMSLSGGVTRAGDATACRVFRRLPGEAETKQLTVNLREAAGKVGGPDDFMLFPGDVVYVPAQKLEASTGAEGEATSSVPAVMVPEEAAVPPEVVAAAVPARPAAAPAPQRREIIVLGEVKGPGTLVFTAKDKLTLMRAIIRAKGFTPFAKKRAVRLIRYDAEGKRTELTVDAARVFDDGYLEDDVSLVDGDLIIVPQKAINF